MIQEIWHKEFFLLLLWFVKEEIKDAAPFFVDLNLFHIETTPYKFNEVWKKKIARFAENKKY